MERGVILDDDDSAITYNGPWFRDNSGALDTMGPLGPQMFGTLHGMKSDGSFTVTFTGTYVVFTISNQFSDPTGINAQCTLDGESLQVVNQTESRNNVSLCRMVGLVDTSHTLVVNVSVTNQETFWLDFIGYIPSASAVSQTVVSESINFSDEDLQNGLSTGWQTFSPGMLTSQTGSSMKFSFSGISLIWLGFFDPSFPWDASLKTATYGLDGGQPVAFDTLFNAATHTSKPGGQLNQVLFQTPELPNTDHSIEVVFHGTNTSTPLTLQFVVAKRPPRSDIVSGPTNTVASSAISGETTPTSPSSSARREPSNKKPTIGALLGRRRQTEVVRAATNRSRARLLGAVTPYNLSNLDTPCIVPAPFTQGAMGPFEQSGPQEERPPSKFTRLDMVERPGTGSGAQRIQPSRFLKPVVPPEALGRAQSIESPSSSPARLVLAPAVGTLRVADTPTAGGG